MTDKTSDLLQSLAAPPFQPRGTRALWQQIADRLQAACHDGRLAGGMRLPGEIHMAQIFGVTRVTMRRALARLQQEGKLQARKGVGIFVRPVPLSYRLDHGRHFSDGLEVSDNRITTRILSLERSSALLSEAQALQLDGDARVIRMVRLRLLDGAPVYVATKTFPAERFPDFEPAYAGHASVRAVYRAHGIPRHSVAETRVGGGFALPSEAEPLHLSPQTPVLRTTTITTDATGRPIELNLGCWPLASVELVLRRD